MATYVFGCGMGYNINTKFKWTTVDWSCKSVINDEWDSCLVCYSCKLFKVKNRDRWISNGFSKNCFCIWSYLLEEVFFFYIVVNKGAFYAHLFHCNTEQVVCTTVNGR